MKKPVGSEAGTPGEGLPTQDPTGLAMTTRRDSLRKSSRKSVESEAGTSGDVHPTQEPRNCGTEPSTRSQNGEPSKRVSLYAPTGCLAFLLPPVRRVPIQRYLTNPCAAICPSPICVDSSGCGCRWSAPWLEWIVPDVYNNVRAIVAIPQPVLIVHSETDGTFPFSTVRLV
jgi:hypothetical protein